METIALNRLGILCAPQGAGLSNEQRLRLLAELGQMGYRLTNPAELTRVSPLFCTQYEPLMHLLAQKRGGDVQYVPLFRSFPTNTPDDSSYLLKRVIGFVGNAFNMFDKQPVLDNGVRVPNWLFNVYDFGADPITQFQSKELFEIALADEAEKTADTHTEWVDICICNQNDTIAALKHYVCKLLYAKASIKEALHADVFALLDRFGTAFIDFKQVVFKETKALLLRFLWSNKQHEAIQQLANTPSDLLRLFAALTNTDISLAQPIKFPKMSRSERKMVLAALETANNLADELATYKGLWLAIGRYLHPGEYAKVYPNTARVFEALCQGTTETYNARTEKLLSQKQLDNLLQHLQQRPGVLARKLHELLRKFPHAQALILDRFTRHANQLQLKNLLVMRRYFEYINHDDYRTVINRKAKVVVLPNNTKGALQQADCKAVQATIEQAIVAKLREKEAWTGQKVWVDPKLKQYTLPLAQRKASDGMISLERGSRIDVDFDKVLRLFVYWKQAELRTDLDLSVMQFDADFRFVGHISYSNLKGEGIVHSGDIQSAPHGATEFIDITLNALDSKVKYLAAQVFKFSGSNFCDIQCHTGWMLRQQVNKEVKSFDIKTVANKYDMNGKGAYALPLLVDLEAKQIVLADLYIAGKRFHNRVEGAHSDVALICSQLNRFSTTKPSLYQLAHYHATARKAVLVQQKELADISFGLQACTYNANEPETILSELI